MRVPERCEGRVRLLNGAPVRAGHFVLLWVQQAQRACANHAVEFAAALADDLDLPVVAVFGLTTGFPEANLRHLTFMLEGLSELRAGLAERGIDLIVRHGEPDAVAVAAAGQAAAIVTDRGYLRIQRLWRVRAAADAPCALFELESDVVVPVDEALMRPAYSAAVLRPAIRRLLPHFLRAPAERAPRRSSLAMGLAGAAIDDPAATLAGSDIDRSTPPSTGIRGGSGEAWRRLERFIREDLAGYASRRPDPAVDRQSGIGPYLHFGQISPVAAALAVQGSGADPADIEAFLEQLIVRRELAMNFTERERAYDTPECLPNWARRTLEAHASDMRPVLYAPEELCAARTHDPYWNAAMLEMRLVGKLHGYMRMYWGKKILEWSGSPWDAWHTALRLNNRFLLDGRDPNGFAGVAWCFGKHDRAWGERPVFGVVRTMTADGLRRKFAMGDYVRRIDEMATQQTDWGEV